VPPTEVPGEWVYPTQPVPSNRNFTFIPLQFDEQTMLWGSTDEEFQGCKNILANFTGRQQMQMFTPPSLRGNIMYPDSLGGIGFHGCAANPEQGTFLCAYLRRPYIVSLFPQAVPYPPWCMDHYDMVDTPYKLCMSEFRSLVNNSFFCSKPPWGLLTMVNISSGALLWTIPLGSQHGQYYKKEWGSTSLSGGPIQTASGLVFITGAGDSTLYVFDARSGTEIHAIPLPCNAMTTPITYKVAGTQFVAVACSTAEQSMVMTYVLQSPQADDTKDRSLVIGLSLGGVFVAGCEWMRTQMISYSMFS